MSSARILRILQVFGLYRLRTLDTQRSGFFLLILSMWVFAPQPVSVDWQRVLLSKCSLSNASQSAGSDALVVMSGLARQPSQRGGSERDLSTPPLLLLLVLGLFSNSISAELNDGLWKARLAPPPRRGKVPRRRGLASICSSPFWVSIFLGPFPLLPQIARNSENNLSTTDGARPVCDQWGSPDRPEGQIVLH